ncbi:adenylyl-sulfate kinase [Gordonia neofelifaecis]|uniref:Adenylyl-sulfate kinase n=1 Tax=Gordonia neofelifaecis NRRL B-59395 TaxID=644548 RepID=F1YIA8_9ACTN|nr:adenylyl-sulfate kinase [Gordonia neofelifaecis]EGD55662.1 bifunctional sulfate adenylyltransferase subunit 1/adenylylsulfate kinase protein [Gordonia neofelifaecis NRRL B-59395]
MSQLLRIATAGSVDDGKSTLIGRLLFDSKSIFEDQLAAVEQTSIARGGEGADLALLTDGLRAEREQGITIDVAHRYFATPKRKFIIADTPGHAQYTRNMVTGASTADLALILIDARNGLVEQTRRHAFIASLLGIPHLVVCINKMDLVDWSKDRYDEICDEFKQFAAKLNVGDLSFVPVSALLGDNVVDKTGSMPWYEGGSLLHHLEEVHVASDQNLIDARLPIQYVIRPKSSRTRELHDHRAYAGTVASGSFKKGDEVVVLPSGFSTRVKAVWGPGGRKLDEAFASAAVSVELEDDIDISRGDMLCRPQNRADVGHRVNALVCWFSDRSQLRDGGRYIVRQATRETKAVVSELSYRLDVNTLHRDEKAQTLGLNEIGRLALRTQQPLLFDPYRTNRVTGSFILIDEVTNDTVAAGMITGPAVEESTVVWHEPTVRRSDRATRGQTVWLTGLSGSGKSTVAVEVERRLVASGTPAYLLDGDNLRLGLNSDLGFTSTDRAENVRRVGEVAKILADAGVVAVVSLISPYRADRDAVRAVHADADLGFTEVHVDTPIDVCRSRDPKKLYQRADAGEIHGFTGVDDPYEVPLDPELRLAGADESPGDLAGRIVDHVLAAR